MTTKSAPL